MGEGLRVGIVVQHEAAAGRGGRRGGERARVERVRNAQRVGHAQVERLAARVHVVAQPRERVERDERIRRSCVRSPVATPRSFRSAEAAQSRPSICWTRAIRWVGSPLSDTSRNSTPGRAAAGADRAGAGSRVPRRHAAPARSRGRPRAGCVARGVVGMARRRHGQRGGFVPARQGGVNCASTGCALTVACTLTNDAARASSLSGQRRVLPASA